MTEFQFTLILSQIWIAASYAATGYDKLFCYIIATIWLAWCLLEFVHDWKSTRKVNG